MKKYEDMYATLEKIPSWKYIDPLNITTSEIEKMCREMVLDVEKKKSNDQIEKKMQVPIMATHFYYYIYQNKKVPTQKEFISFYVRTNKDWIQDNLKTNELKEALFGRLSRTYPSLLRDIHFYHLLKESRQFEKVLYNLRYDLRGKVDVFVQKENKAYGLQLRTLTKNSNEYYKKKPNRGAIPPKSVLIDVPIDLSNAKSIPTKMNDVKLYGKSQIKQVLEAIKKAS